MVGWHQQWNGHEVGQTVGDGWGQGSLVCCSPWCHDLVSEQNKTEFSSVQSFSHVWLSATPWAVARQASLSITNSECIQNHSHLVGDAIKPCHPQSSPSPPAFNLSQHQDLKIFHAVNKQHTSMIIFYTTTPNLSDSESSEGRNLMLK